MFVMATYSCDQHDVDPKGKLSSRILPAMLFKVKTAFTLRLSSSFAPLQASICLKEQGKEVTIATPTVGLAHSFAFNFNIKDEKKRVPVASSRHMV